VEGLFGLSLCPVCCCGQHATGHNAARPLKCCSSTTTASSEREWRPRRELGAEDVRDRRAPSAERSHRGCAEVVAPARRSLDDSEFGNELVVEGIGRRSAMIGEDFEPDLGEVPGDRLAVRSPLPVASTRIVSVPSLSSVTFRSSEPARKRSRTVTGAHPRAACGICGLSCCRSPTRALSSRGRPEAPSPGTAYGEARIGGQVSASPYCALGGGGPTFCDPNAKPPGPSPSHLQPGLGEAERKSLFFCHSGAEESRVLTTERTGTVLRSDIRRAGRSAEPPPGSNRRRPAPPSPARREGRPGLRTRSGR
jgi:hypothetical protein